MTLGNSTLWDIYGEVPGKPLNPGAVKKILVIDWERIRGNRSCSPET
jgi:hypothetical protein